MKIVANPEAMWASESVKASPVEYLVPHMFTKRFES
jgi:hypothetical protein